MNVLIVGAGGFIGSHLSEGILQSHEDWKVIALDISSDKVEHLIDNEKFKGRFEFHRCDILKEFDIQEEMVQKSDVVLPLAAIASPLVYVQNPLKVFELDFEANLRIIRWCVKHKKRVIFPSTSEVYGMCSDEEYDEEDSNCVTGPICKQRWIYSCSKQMMDRVIYAYGQRNELQFTLFRPFNWIGPRLDDIYNEKSGSSRVVTQFLSNIMHRKPISLVDGGRQIRSFTDIDDAMRALMKILENVEGCADQQIFNIGNPYNQLSIKDLAYMVIEVARDYEKIREAAENTEIKELPGAKYYGKSYQDVQCRVPSIKRAEEKLGWKPCIGTKDALKKIFDYYFG